MSSIKRIALVLLIILCGVTVFALMQRGTISSPPTWEDRDAHVKKLSQELHELANQIQKHHGGSRCEESRDCKVVGLGASACSGYKDFLIYSVRAGNNSELLKAVELFNSKAAEITKLSFSVPSCGGKAKEIRCVRGSCVPVRE